MSHQPKEEAAYDTANELLMSAISAVNSIAMECGFPADPVLIAAHAIIAKQDSIETSLLEALRDLRESVDFMASGTGGERGELNDARWLIAYLKTMELTQPEVMRELRERMGTTDVAPAILTTHQREVIYRALEEDYLLNYQAATVGEMDAALRQFKIFAGL